jgi:HPt (histidine-containing phosphotransfer) domain-containing protein
LISVAGNVGATRLSGIARELEVACRSDDLNQALSLVDELLADIKVASSAVREWLDGKCALERASKRLTRK